MFIFVLVVATAALFAGLFLGFVAGQWSECKHWQQAALDEVGVEKITDAEYPPLPWE